MSLSGKQAGEAEVVSVANATSGCKQVGTTPDLLFRAVIGFDGATTVRLTA